VNPNFLFPSADARRVTDDGLTATLSDACARVKGGSVVPIFDRDFFADELATFDFEAPRRLEDVIGWAIWAMESGPVMIVATAGTINAGMIGPLGREVIRGVRSQWGNNRE
jgi:hypothetical protein